MSHPARRPLPSPSEASRSAVLSTLKYLRQRATVYLSEAAATTDAAHRRRLIMLAARCQEMMAEREAKDLSFLVRNFAN